MITFVKPISNLYLEQYDFRKFMENIKTIAEPLRITNSGKYELYDYSSSGEITISRAFLLSSNINNDLNTTIKIISKENQMEFDRFMLAAFRNPSEPDNDKINIKGKFFDPKKYFLRVEPKNTGEEVHFMLYFSVKA
jgi:hypothetical protein